MTSNMTRGLRGIFFLAFAFALGAAAQDQDQDLIISTLSGSLVVSGNPTLTGTNPTTLTSGAMDIGKQQYLVMYDLANNPTASCPLTLGWTVQVGQTGSNVGITVKTGSSLVVTAQTGAFASVPGSSGYIAWQLSPYTPDSYFTVIDSSNTAQCTSSLGTTDYSKHFLRITTETVSVTNRKPTDPGDLPIPIIGSSLRFIAPGAEAFDCASDKQTATLEVHGNAGVLQVTHPKPPNPRQEPFMSLAGSSDWKITAYPQQLEISPSFIGTKLKFKVPSSSKLVCDKNANGNFLNVVNTSDGHDTSRPQVFVVDWLPGLFETRRFLTVPCVNCYLLLGIIK